MRCDVRRHIYSLGFGHCRLKRSYFYSKYYHWMLNATFNVLVDMYVVIQSINNSSWQQPYRVGIFRRYARSGDS